MDGPPLLILDNNYVKCTNLDIQTPSQKPGVGSSELEEISHWVGSSHMPTSTLSKSYTSHSV